MNLSRKKATAFQRPAKFNFLEGRQSAPRREWPLGHTPDEAKKVAKASVSKRGAK